MPDPVAPTALVTGASRGIGRGIAVALGGIGWNVIVNYAGNLAAAEECCALVRQAGGQARPVQGDVGEPAGRAALVDAAFGWTGRVDLLVNNAGIAPKVRADILDADESSFDDLIRVNLKGPYFLTRDVAKRMTTQAGPTRGQIVTITSISTYTASVNRGDYCISKAGLGMLTKLFATRLADDGIRVYEIRPGVIATDMTGPVKAKYDALIADGLTPIKRWGEPADIGAAVVAIARGLLPFSTGQVIDVDGGFHLHTL